MTVSERSSGSTLDGDDRVCTLGEQSPAPGAVLREKLLSADDAVMRLEYTVTDAPFPVEFHDAIIDIIPGTNGSTTVSWTTTVVPDELAAMFSPGFDSDLQNLKGLVEAG